MQLSEILAAFDALAHDKGWQPLHTPKNLAMALGVEVAELHRHLQWRDDREIEQLMSTDARAEVAAELADIQMYLIKLSASLGVDLEQAVADKIAENRGR